jgi:hypothetical protein
MNKALGLEVNGAIRRYFHLDDLRQFDSHVAFAAMIMLPAD